jgi:hypothetical protein
MSPVVVSVVGMLRFLTRWLSRLSHNSHFGK